MSDLRRQWNESCLAAGIPSLSTETCAMILAVVYVADSDENIVMNLKLKADIDYIQKRFNIIGGYIPDSDFIQITKGFVMAIQGNFIEYGDYPQFVKDLFKEYYNIELRKPCISK